MAAEGNLGSLYFTLGLDDKDFKTKMEAITKKYGGLITEIQKVKSPSLAAANAQNGLADSAGKVATETKRESSALQQLAKDVRSAQNAALQEIATSGRQSQASKDKVATSQRLSQQYRDMRRELNGLPPASEKAEAAATKHAKSQRGLGASMFFSNGEMRSSIRLSGALTNQMGMLFSVYAAERFIRAMVDIRGQFELQQVSLRAILQDAGAADKIFAELQGLAVKSPFQFLDLVSYAKQLSAFSVQAKDLFQTTKTLADISAGLGVDMSRIILAYGQVKSASVLRGQELRQFTEAGIPLVDELAKKFTELTGTVTTTGDVFDKISKREVSFKMVAGVFEEMTSAGGKFYKMQEKQAETLKGKISNLVDAYQISLNKLGASQDDILKSGADLAMRMATNLEPIIKVLSTLIVTWGLYKTAQMAGLAIGFLENISKQIAAVRQLSVAVNLLTKEQLIANAAVRANLYIAIAQALVVAVGLVTGGILAFRKEAKTSQEIVDDLTTSTTRLSNAGKDIDKLVKQYEDLGDEMKSGKSGSESYAEAERKRGVVVNEMIRLVPEAAKREKEYGDIIGINISKVREYSAEQRKNAIAEAQMNISAARSEADRLRAEQKTLNAKIEASKLLSGFTGIKPGIVSMTLGTQPITYKQDANENAKITAEYNKNAERLEVLNASITSSEAIISTIGQAEVETAKILVGWREKYNKSVESLGEKYKITETEAEKTIDEIAKARTADYESDLATYKAMINAKVGIYTQAEKDKQKELVRTDKLAAQYAGATFGKKEEEAANKEKISSAQRQAAIERDMLKISDIATKAEITLADAKLSAMGDGYLKQKKQQEVKFEEEKLRIKKQGEYLLELQNKIDVNRFIKENPNYKKEGKVPPTSKVLNIENQQIIKNMTAAIVAENEAATTKLLKDKLIEYGDYATERLEIERKFNADIKALESERTATNKEQIDSAILQAETDKAKALMSQSFKKLKESPEFALAFEDLGNVSTETLEKLMSELERLKQTAAGTMSLSDFKEYSDVMQNLTDEFTERNPFKALEKSANDLREAQEELKLATRDLQNVQAGGKVATGVKNGVVQYLSLAKAQERVSKATNNVTEETNNGDKALKEITDSYNDLFKNVSSVGDAMGGIAGQIISSIGSIGSFVTTTIDGVKAVSATGAAAISTVEKASVILAIISTAIQVATAIVNIFTAASKKRKEAAEKERQAQLDAYYGILDYNMELREQYDLTQKIGEARLAWIDREKKALIDQAAANKKTQDALLAKLDKHEFSFTDGKKTFLDYEDFDKLYTDLSLMSARGSLSADGQKFYEAVKKAHDEGVALTETQDEFFENIRELYAGTTFSAVSDAIVEGFRNGKRSAVDFADTFESLMQGAVQSALSLQADAGTRKWFEDFAAASESGGVLTKDEQAELKKKWDTLIAQMAATTKEIEDATGVSITSADTESAGLKGEVSNMTEPTASRLTGLLYAILTDSGKRASDLKIIVDAHLGGGINVFDSRVNSQLVELNIKIAESNRVVGNIEKLIGSVITQGSDGKAFRVR